MAVVVSIVGVLAVQMAVVWLRDPLPARPETSSSAPVNIYPRYMAEVTPMFTSTLEPGVATVSIIASEADAIARAKYVTNVYTWTKSVVRKTTYDHYQDRIDGFDGITPHGDEEVWFVAFESPVVISQQTIEEAVGFGGVSDEADSDARPGGFVAYIVLDMVGNPIDGNFFGSVRMNGSEIEVVHSAEGWENFVLSIPDVDGRR